MVNLLPLKEGETITTLMPLPEDEASWDKLFVMFATASADVRRNQLSDFVNVMTNGKIAMKLEEGDRLIGVQVCREDQDVLLAAKGGKCIRFPVTDVRVFAGRSSTGVRGMRLGKDDRVISMSMLRHVDFDTVERDAYLRIAAARRRQEGVDEGEAPAEAPAATLSEARIAELAANEEFILSVTENGFGKRSSAYDYRIAGRGGQGIANIETSERNGPVVGSFAVGNGDDIMMVSDGGQLIRCGVKDIRIAGRNTQGVTLFSLGENERMVSVTRLAEEQEPAEDDASEANVASGEAEEGA
jgi:DNA gyrase subunit A